MYSLLKEQVDNIKKVMIYESADDVYVFLYDTQENKSCIADFWFETLDEALEYCKEKYNVKQELWIIINDPKEGEHHDIMY